MITGLIRAGALSLAFVAGSGAGTAQAEAAFIVIQSASGPQDSGLMDYLLPGFAAETGIEVQVVSVGTGQALRNARNGEGDVVLGNDRAAELVFVAEGSGVARYDLMYNDFVLVGPGEDPAQVKGVTDIAAALRIISGTNQVFASRGDESGTHVAELRYWSMAGITVSPSDEWYHETASGMGATLNLAIGLDAYVLTDRATWVAFGNKAEHEILVAGDPRLYNQYGITLVNPEVHPGTRAEAGQRFIDWLLSENGRAAIASYQVDGQQLFFPNLR